MSEKSSLGVTSESLLIELMLIATEDRDGKSLSFFVTNSDKWKTSHFYAALGRTEELSKMGKAILDERDSFGWTPLHWASAMGDEETVATLLEMGADPNAKSNCGESPAESALRWDMHASMIKGFLKEKCESELGESFSIRAGGSELSQEILERLFAVGGEPEKIGNDGLSLLMLASKKRMASAVTILLKAGARKNGGEMAAVLEGGSEVAAMALLDAGEVSSFKTEDGSGIMHLAADGGMCDLLAKAIELGGICGERDANGRTPLHRAAEGEMAGGFSMLMRMSALMGRDELAPAKAMLRKRGMMLLLNAGADPNAKDEEGNSPLDKLWKENCPEGALLLLNAGAELGSSTPKEFGVGMEKIYSGWKLKKNVEEETKRNATVKSGRAKI